MKVVGVCGRCGEKRYDGDVVCWYCSGLYKNVSECPTCGQLVSLSERVKAYVKAGQLE